MVTRARTAKASHWCQAAMVGVGEVEETDQRCRDTEENQIELRVDDE